MGITVNVNRLSRTNKFHDLDYSPGEFYYRRKGIARLIERAKLERDRCTSDELSKDCATMVNICNKYFSLSTFSLSNQRARKTFRINSTIHFVIIAFANIQNAIE